MPGKLMDIDNSIERLLNNVTGNNEEERSPSMPVWVTASEKIAMCTEGCKASYFSKFKLTAQQLSKT